MSILKGYTKQELSWMMYDWANSAHSVIVVTLLPIFFDSVASFTADSVSSLSTWGYATSLAMAIVAVSAPLLGVFGDIRGMRKRLFAAFVVLGAAAVALLSFTPLMDFTSSTEAAGRVAGMILALYIVDIGAIIIETSVTLIESVFIEIILFDNRFCRNLKNPAVHNL